MKMLVKELNASGALVWSTGRIIPSEYSVLSTSSSKVIVYSVERYSKFKIGTVFLVGIAV